jgi:hypothetical protein
VLVSTGNSLANPAKNKTLTLKKPYPKMQRKIMIELMQRHMVPESLS